jgi:hypothetical protein
MASEFGMTLSVGGPGKLDITSQLDDGGCSVQLAGEVFAPTELGAMVAAERTVEAFLGASTALGLVTHVDLIPGARGKTDLEHLEEYVEVSGKRRPFGQRVEDILERLVLRGAPPDLSDLERMQLERGNHEAALARHTRTLAKTLGSDSDRALQVRNACRLALRAIHDGDAGVAMTLAFCVIEGLLLEPGQEDNVVARLSEAVAHSLGSSAEERANLRKKAKDLYKHRSEFVHTGSTSGRLLAVARSEVPSLALRVVRREMELLP